MEYSNTNIALIVSALVAIIAVGLAVAYQTGALNPVIEELGKFYFKVKAKAEEKKMEAEGLKEGEDFLKGDLKGNKQAEDIQTNLGDLNKLKKGI